ncbi:MAG: hypothetical protein HYU66_13015 [Armatimonadetes bacterium]|nr:hypothetical protein [Armatimonadota bacterium]
MALAALAGYAAWRHATAVVPGCKGVEPGVSIHTGAVVFHVLFDDREQRVLTAGKLPSSLWALEVWSLPGGRLVARRKVRGVTTVAFSADGRQVAFVAGTQPARCMLWRPDSAATPVQLGVSWGEMWNLCFSPDGSMVAAAGEHTRARVWSTRPGGAGLNLDAPGLRWPGPFFTPDSRHLVVSDFNGLTRLLDLSRREEVARWADDSVVERPLSLAGDRFIGGAGPELTIFELPSGREVSHLEDVSDSQPICDMGFSRDGRSIVGLATYEPSPVLFGLLTVRHHGVAVRWDAGTGRRIGHTRLPQMSAEPPFFRADLELAKPLHGGLIDTLTGRRIAVPHGSEAGYAAFSPRGGWMAEWGYGPHNPVVLTRLVW